MYLVFVFPKRQYESKYDFWLMNAMCTFMYLFVVYFSFAPVILLYACVCVCVCVHLGVYKFRSINEYPEIYFIQTLLFFNA